ncbi:NAD-dependent methanol dehydrogenase [Polystyrenella longa]|uniref:NAD-dependent methanol dehydrogenase n=1 Tax=Polystyrenella longa TaxID=2528007 RepID=A0A518CI51_9PLAN|nr:iron-containing alcohol dehydrogenase [Polystyrenella longa]QDU78906.1 NAD-dependent methanol dehydrogenase [Polystyrenella longa]
MDPTSFDEQVLKPFDYVPLTRVVYGAGTLSQLGDICVELQGQRVLLVTDRGLHSAGHAGRACEILADANLDVVLFEEVQPNPTTEDVDRGLQVARDEKIDLIIGLGGGSSMDCAKGINFLLTNGGRMQNYWGVGKATEPMLPMVAVPTTAGTGSEAQSFALIADAETHMKMACGDKKAACKVAILDPELTTSMPKSVTVVTGIDAISHAVETYVTTKRNIISETFSLRSFQLLVESFPIVLNEPNDLEARGRMLLGAHLAGAAIENSMLGATHALANPLSAHFGTTHGTAIGILLPHVVRFNSTVADYTELVRSIGLQPTSSLEAGELLADHLMDLFRNSDTPQSLSAISFDENLIPQLASEAAAQWTGQFNPRPVSAESLQEIYQCALQD